MKAWTQVLLLAALALGMAAGGAGSALAAQCAPARVSARGEPSVFQWLALTKAKGNWRAKVRRTKALGGLYADWRRAENRTEDCGPDGKGIACTVSAVPCRP